MTSKRPVPLKDEPVTPLDELQDLLAANIAAINALSKAINNRPDMQPVTPEAVAAAAKNAVKELLEQRQRDFEREEKEAKAQGRLTPQECYTRMSAEYADVLEKCGILCDTYKHIEEVARRQEARYRRVEAKLDALIAKQGIQAADTTKATFPAHPKRFKGVVAYLFKDIPLYGLHRAYRSRHVRLFVWICLLCIWILTIATACFIAYDNTMMRREKENCPVMYGQKPAAKTVLQTANYSCRTTSFAAARV